MEATTKPTNMNKWIVDLAAENVMRQAEDGYRMLEIHRREPARIEKIDLGRVNPEIEHETVEAVVIPVWVGMRDAGMLNVFAELLKPRVEGTVIKVDGVEVVVEYDVTDLVQKTSAAKK
jgi:hypothetical protein